MNYEALTKLDEIDYERVILNLRSKRWSLPKISRETGVELSKLAAITYGRSERPKRDIDAIRLIDLHYDQCPDRHGSLTR